MIVLDTHTLVWWVTGDDALSKKAKTAIDHELNGGQIIVSAISAWEIAMLVERERLVLSMNVESWLATVAKIDAVRFGCNSPKPLAGLVGYWQKNHCHSTCSKEGKVAAHRHLL